MLHHVLTFTNTKDFAQAMAKYALFKGVNLQATINSTTITMRIYSNAGNDQVILDEFVEECSDANLGFVLHHEEVKTTADLYEETLKQQEEISKLQSELTNLRKEKDLYMSVYKSTSKELDRYKAAVNMFREQLNLIFPQPQ